jgi:Na+/proline symporter
MHLLSKAWAWWRDSWRRPRVARRLYLLMAAAFAVLAVAAGVLGDVAVAVLAGVLAVVGVALSMVMPELARRIGQGSE